jgi:hypothetical protein
VTSGAESAYSLAVRTAYGLDAPLDLESALQHLHLAAEGGHRSAQTELAALVGNWRLVREITSGKRLPPDIWQRLRAAVDARAWLSMPAGAAALCSEPRIAMARRFISAGVCDWLISLARPHLQRARTFDPDTGQTVDDGARTNRGAEFLPERIDTMVAFVRARIAAFTGLSPSALETSQVLHYAVGEVFAPHYDFLNVKHAGHARQVTQYGQRVLTVLIYLNESYEDGETYFPKLERGFKGRKGDALIFWNVTPDGAPDPLTMHMGSAPTSGEKWLFSQWIRMRA